MSSLPILPTTPARFRAGEVDRLHSALKIIICARAGHLLNGHSKNERYWRVVPDRYPPLACFDAELMDRPLELWARLCALRQDEGAKSHRFALSLIDIWFLTLAIRMARHEDRCHAPKGKPRSSSTKWSNLLHKLDRLQGKARRAWLRSAQAGLYKSYRSRWKGHGLWLRISYGCLCQQPAIAPGHRRLYLQRGLEVAKEALMEAEIQAPDEKQLRDFVRLAFREIRRGRQAISIGEILRGGQRARFILAYFIEKRLRKAGQLKFLSNSN